MYGIMLNKEHTNNIGMSLYKMAIVYDDHVGIVLQEEGFCMVPYA